MAVTINKTDGIVLTTIQDGNIDTASTNLALIGRLYRNYGELVNENFVKLLENFANSSAPTSPIVGQLWYNTSTGSINIYRATGFTGLANLTTSAAQPNSPRQSDLWFDTVDGQLKLYSGTAWIVVSPLYSSSQLKTGVFAETIRDVLNSNHVCIVHYQRNNVVAIQSIDAEWTPQVAISGFSSIKPGLNLANINNQQFIGTAVNANSLGNIAGDKFLRNDTSGVIDGSLSVSNEGLIIGELDDLQIYIEGNNAIIGKADGNLSFFSGLNQVMTINDSPQVQFRDGTEGTPSISFAGDTNTGIYRAAENIIGLSVSGQTILEVSDGGIFVNGDIQANNFTGILNADSVVATNLSVSNSTVTNSLQVNTNTILGTTSVNSVTIRASNITIPNGLVFSTANITLNGQLRLANVITSTSAAPVTIDSDLYVSGAAEIDGTLTINTGIDVGGILVSDTSGRLTLNSAVATGYANVGDFSMGSTNAIRSYNSPKMWVAFNGTLAGLAIYDSFNIDFVTRTSTNNYTFTTEYPISSGAMAVVGTNGTSLVTAPSIGATSFSITTTSEGTRMALVVLSQ